MVRDMEHTAREKPRASPDYLMQLINDKKLMASLPNFCGIFTHLERLLDEEISRVRKDMYVESLSGGAGGGAGGGGRPELPEPEGAVVTLQQKLYIPTKEYPDFNFVGRILGPRGLTAKQLEAETGCKIMVRGKSSMRDRKKEEQNRGKPNWEHLSEELHVLVTVEDTQNRADAKLQRAVAELKKLLVPAAEGEDNLKKMQLMELAIINGTYRDGNSKSQAMLGFSLAAAQAPSPRLIAGPPPPPGSVMTAAALRTAQAGGPNPPPPATPAASAAAAAALMPLMRPFQGAPPAGLVPSAADGGGLIYTPYEYSYPLAHPGASILEYPFDPSAVVAEPWRWELELGAAPWLHGAWARCRGGWAV
ncbi:KH domain-containing RNA-binding protein QKI isoform X3 [Petromyzon marinus]|uniref:KH domain-containing RNA-binding protein QKI isoform X3 n=1 Tax=Petromyzon marinus TaxID=7757 RepID=UPI003F72212D